MGFIPWIWVRVGPVTGKWIPVLLELHDQTKAYSEAQRRHRRDAASSVRVRTGSVLAVGALGLGTGHMIIAGTERPGLLGKAQLPVQTFPLPLPLSTPHPCHSNTDTAALGRASRPAPKTGMVDWHPRQEKGGGPMPPRFRTLTCPERLCTTCSAHVPAGPCCWPSPTS